VYNSLNVDKFLKDSESNIEDAFMEEHAFMKQQSESAKKLYNECTQTHNIIGRIVNKLVVFLSASYDYLLYSQFDENIRMECFWRRTGFNFYPPRNPLHGTLFFQHISDVDWHIRTELPLPQFIDPQDSTCQTGFYPDMTDNHPKYFGAPLIQAKPTSVSGHWIGDPCEFSSLVIVCPEHSLHTYFVDMYGAEAARQQSTSTITTAAFAACVAQAHNQGFNWLMDITYPFTTQAVYCDGSTVQFCAYQLNTLEMWKNNEAVPTRNIAWITEGQQVYEAIEEGMVKGLNKEVVSQLVKMLVLEPMEPTYDLRPYLPDDPSPRLT
jgi:small subunit ribosomal protein S30